MHDDHDHDEDAYDAQDDCDDEVTASDEEAEAALQEQLDHLKAHGFDHG